MDLIWARIYPLLATLYMECFVYRYSFRLCLPIWFGIEICRRAQCESDIWEPFDLFVSRLNDLDPINNFEVKWEREGKLPFLDSLIMRYDGHLSFTVYRKPTHSGSYLHVFSNHSDRVKEVLP